MGIMGRGVLVRVRVLLQGITLRVTVPGLFMGTSFLGFGFGFGFGFLLGVLLGVLFSFSFFLFGLGPGSWSWEGLGLAPIFT